MSGKIKKPFSPSGRKNVLIVAPHPPFPLNQGGNVRLWSLCQNLKAKYSFSLISFVNPALLRNPARAMALQLQLSAVFDRVDFVSLPMDPRVLWTRYSEKTVRQNPAFLDIGEKIQAALRNHPVDLVHVEHIQMAYCRKYVWGPPVLLTEYDLGWVRFSGSLYPGYDGGSTWRRFVPWLRNFWDYRRLCRSFQGVVVTSPLDQAWWRRWGAGGVPVEHVPTGVDVRRFRFRPQEPPLNPPELLFVGHFHHAPNSDAAAYFLKDIWPGILAEMPLARVTFVGPEPPPWLRARAGEQVRVTGEVESVVPFLGAAHVFVAPMRLGWGIKGKISEAFAAGVPVVASPVAMAGFEEDAKGFVRLGRNAGEFAKETLNLLKNRPLQSEISRKARRWIEENYPWERCADRLDRFYRTFLNRS